MNYENKSPMHINYEAMSDEEILNAFVGIQKTLGRSDYGIPFPPTFVSAWTRQAEEMRADLLRRMRK